MTTPKRDERCPIAYSVELFGDRWSLVIVRDMLMGKKRFSEFLESSESITSSVLADRLRQLGNSGLVTKARYQSNPVRYEYALTVRGNGLLPVLQAISAWGTRYLPKVKRPPERFTAMKLE